MKSKEIRKRFFDFFEKHGHTKVPSSSLIPAQDPTLLFANAGMNQFKDVFLGVEKRSYTRAVSIQKCVRAGGKHNDLDNVGFTKRHLTFFEMMGNFSFGDYFKKEAIQFAWKFLTNEMNIPKDNLHASVYKDDDTSYEIWRDMIKLPEDKIHRLGAAENFWQMGDTGPCGPCSEIHLDRGPDFGCKEQCDPACECDRFLEIWNLVFMQFDRQVDGKDLNLKQTGVDTGMGLERLATVLQNVDSVFETDLFAEIIAETEKLSHKKYTTNKAAFNVIADHVRSSSLLIADGCAPSNDGRGYVLRKIIRRAALFAQKLTDKNIFPQLSGTFVEVMGDIYPELRTNKKLISNVLTSEINKFAKNLVRGKTILERYFATNKETKIINGEQAFKLYDTYGFPTELIEIIAKENGFTVDTEGFKKEMAKQKSQSGKKETDSLQSIHFENDITSEFTGYDELETPSKIIAIVHDGKSVQSVPANTDCFVIAKKSPFFIVGGGQVPDEGWLVLDGTKVPITSVQYIHKGIAPKIKTPHAIKVGDPVTSIVDPVWRTNAMKNHTATHMLQSALIELLGKQVKQSGSLVHPDYLRFDFTYHENLSPEQVKKVEDRVNEKIRQNIPVDIEYTTMKKAISRGALAFFGDKYNPENVRLVNIPDFSAELCGGTHVPRTGDIGTFKITEVTALSAGHRRIVALTGPKAISLFQDSYDTAKKLSQLFKVKRHEVYKSVLQQKEQLKKTQTEIKQLKKELWKSSVPVWAEQVETIEKIPFLFLPLENYTSEELREINAALQTQKPGMYFLANTVNGHVTFLCTLSPELTNQIDLKKFGSWLKENHELRGGGSKNSLQGGGVKFDTNLKSTIKQWLAKK